MCASRCCRCGCSAGPAFTGVQIAALTISGSIFSLFLYLSLYLQNYLGLSPLQTGLRYLPITLAVFFASPLAGLLLPRVAPRVLLFAGLATVAGGLVLMGGIDSGDGWTTLLPGFIVAGIGIGLLNPVIADVAVSVVPRAQSGMASGINDTFRQIGRGHRAGGVGRGVRRPWRASRDRADRGTATTRRAISSRACRRGAAPAGRGGAVADAARAGFLSGMNEVFVLGALVAFVGAVLALWLVRGVGVAAETSTRARRPIAWPRRRSAGLSGGRRTNPRAAMLGRMDDQDWEARVAALWTAFDDHVARRLPRSRARARRRAARRRRPRAVRAGLRQRLHRADEAEAERLYRAAMDAGLTGIRRRRAAIQYASTLRNLGRADESARILLAERQAGSDELDDAVTAFLALALTDLGREREAASLALRALAPHLPRYQRSLGAYAADLLSGDEAMQEIE